MSYDAAWLDNYAIRAIGNPPAASIIQNSHHLVHIHYHQMFSEENLPKNPLFQDNFKMEEDFKV